MKPLFALLFSLIASAAAATFDAWPALYDVSGVASDDVLNIRAEPSADAPIIGTLAHDATNVEIIRDGENGWGLVNTDEGTAGYPSPICNVIPISFSAICRQSPNVSELNRSGPLCPMGMTLWSKCSGWTERSIPAFGCINRCNALKTS